jgi:hypothetical protein
LREDFEEHSQRLLVVAFVARGWRAFRQDARSGSG